MSSPARSPIDSTNTDSNPDALFLCRRLSGIQNSPARLESRTIGYLEFSRFEFRIQGN
jgi:hypothetical protein